jgi:hypothetical protein
MLIFSGSIWLLGDKCGRKWLRHGGEGSSKDDKDVKGFAFWVECEGQVCKS